MFDCLLVCLLIVLIADVVCSDCCLTCSCFGFGCTLLFVWLGGLCV